MAVEESIIRRNDRIAALSQFLRTAHAGRRIKETAVARKVRRRLIVWIEETIYAEQELLEYDLKYQAETTKAQRDRDEEVDPDFYADWNNTPDAGWREALLDDTLIMGLGIALDLKLGREYRVADGFPIRIKVRDDELASLDPLLSAIERETGVTFVIERIFYKEDALVSFVLAEEAREQHARPEATAR